MQEVVRQLSERLAAKGHDVTVATSFHRGRAERTIGGVRVESFHISGNMVNGYRGEKEEQDRYRALLRDGVFDVVVNFAAQQWATDLALPILGEIKAKKVFVPTGFSGLYLAAYRDYFSRMPEWMRRYDVNVFLSETYRDARFAEEHGVGHRTVIPNGAAEEEFLVLRADDIREEIGVGERDLFVLLVGSHTGKKGHEEAIRMFDEADISHATLVLTGGSFDRPSPQTFRERARIWSRSLYKSLRNECPFFCRRAARSLNDSDRWRRTGKRLLIRDLPRDAVVRAFLAADIFLFPSRIECSPIVLFEAAASRTPFLSTDVGNATEIARWTGGGRILPTRIDGNGLSHADIEGSTRMLEDLSRDEEARRAMGEVGYASWRESFTWAKITERYEAVYKGINFGNGDQR